MKRLILALLLTVSLTSFSQIYRLTAYHTSGYNAKTNKLVVNHKLQYTVYLSTEYSDIAIPNYYGEGLHLKIKETSVENGDPLFMCRDVYGNYYGITLGEGVLSVYDPVRNRITKIKFR